MMKCAGGPRTVWLAALALLLPWQTRWIIGEVPLAGGHTEYGVLSVYATQVLLLGGWVVLGVWDGPFFRLRLRSGVGTALGLLAPAVVLSVLRAEMAPVALNAAFQVFAAGVLVIALVDERVCLRPVMMAFALGLVIPLALGAWQMMAGGSPSSTWLGLASRDAARAGDAIWSLGGERVLRAYGSFPHPNIFGGSLAVALTGWWVCAARMRGRWRWVVAAFLVLGLMMTGSRAALLALATGGLALILVRTMSFERAKRWVAAAVATVIVGTWAAVVFAPGSVALIRGGGGFEARSLEERVLQLEEAVAVIRSSDGILGEGAGMYVFALADAIMTSQPAWWYQPVHIVPVLLFIELGVVGILAVGLVLTFAVRTDRPLGVALLACVAVLAFFDHYLWTSWSGLVLVAVTLAVTLRLSTRESDSEGCGC